MSSGRSPGEPRSGAATPPRDPNDTDPNATYPAPDAGGGHGAWARVTDDDATQVYDAGAAAKAMLAPAKTGFVLVALAGPKAGARFDLGADEVVIGRSDEVGISIPDVSVSRRHATFVQQTDGAFFINDLGSGNGTKINGVRVVSGTARHGDEIAVGDSVLQLIDENAPPPVRGRKVPAKVTGEVANDGASTRFNNPKIAAPPPVVAAGAQAGNKRLRVYAIVGVALVAVFVVAAIAKNRDPERKQVAASVDSEAETLFRDAKGLAFNHKWIEAVRKAEDALELSEDDGVIEQFLEKARVEAKHQQQVAEAKEKLGALDFKGAGELLAQVPRIADVGPQARELRQKIDQAIESTLAQASDLAKSDKDQAKTLVARVLDAEPAHAGARALLETLEKPEPVVAAPKGTKQPQSAAPSTAPKPVVARPPDSQNSVAHEAYIAGDLTRALQLAEEAGDPTGAALAKQIRAFDTNYRQGMQLAKEERAAEAVKTLGVAVNIDKSIAGAKRSKPGAEARLQLANMEYLLGIYCKGDEGLPCAARHFRAALSADPSHQLASKQLNKVEARAREIYTEAYVMKGNSPDRALRFFKISRDSLLPSDETYQKADRWYTNLGGS